MARIKFPQGTFTKEHFGTAKDQIKVIHNLNDTYTLKLGRKSYTVSSEFYMDRLAVQSGYYETKKYFEGFFYGTEKGRMKRDETFVDNFEKAINAKYNDASPKLIQMAKKLFQNMTLEHRERFAEENKAVVESFFDYEDKSSIYFSDAYEPDREQANTDINTDVIQQLLQQYPEWQQEEYKKIYNFKYYQKRYKL